MDTQSGNDRMAAIRRVASGNDHETIDGTMIDPSTAGVIVAVYDALSPKYQAQWMAIPAERMGWMALALVAKAQGRIDSLPLGIGIFEGGVR